MDDERLKTPQRDYFDELLERIRDIRSSELRFYQKVQNFFTLGKDYRANEIIILKITTTRFHHEQSSCRRYYVTN